MLIQRVIFFAVYLCSLWITILLADDQRIYCPAKIICELKDELDSCTYDSEQEHYWGRVIERSAASALNIGIYKNTYVSASHHSKEPGFALCIYTHETDYRTLALMAKPEAMLEVYELKDPQWRSSETWWECKPRTHESCPLRSYNKSIKSSVL